MYYNLECRNKQSYEPIIHLTTPITHGYNYEIGLMRVELRSDFDNTPFNRYIQFVKEGQSSQIYTLPRVHYDTVAQVNDAIRKFVNDADLKNFVELTTMKVTQTKWTLSPGIKIRMSMELKKWLGLATKDLNAEGRAQKLTVLCTPDLKRNYRRIFVKSDLALSNQYYRNSMNKILDSFSAASTIGAPAAAEEQSPLKSSLSYEFANPIYQQINENVIENVKLQFCDEEGRVLTHDREAISWALVHIRPRVGTF